MAGNKIELWGRLLNEPELRTTPAGTPVLRMNVECAEGQGRFELSVVMTGDRATQLWPALKKVSAVRVTGALRALRRRLKSGLSETFYEVMADSIEIEN